MKNWGELYYDHFHKFLGQPIDRKIYQQDNFTKSIQVLVYEKVFSKCMTFCSLGLSHYSKSIQKTAEVCLVVDDAFDDSMMIFSNLLFYIVKKEFQMGWGLGIGGVKNINPNFEAKYKKAAIYITSPYPFPDDFSIIKMPQSNTQIGHVFWGFFISKMEYQYFKKYGAESFESMIEKKGIDPFSISRKSCI